VLGVAVLVVEVLCASLVVDVVAGSIESRGSDTDEPVVAASELQLTASKMMAKSATEAFLRTGGVWGSTGLEDLTREVDCQAPPGCIKRCLSEEADGVVVLRPLLAEGARIARGARL
jgi:hypothetical protein